MPEYRPTSLHSSYGAEQWAPFGSGDHVQSVDDPGTHNGDTDYIFQTSVGGADVSPYAARTILWLNESPLPGHDPTDLKGGSLKLYMKTIIEVINVDELLGWTLYIALGLGDPGNGDLIAWQSFPIHELPEGAYDLVEIPFQEVILALLSPSSLRPYVILEVRH